ncbi:type II secretion system protein GspG [Mariniblastus fucicola]|uniref:Bacterial type II secretion system protein G n=1 Tax=Mariniblastus fucicola TaxID=980251 RepID=A0A5B9PGU2_9BACT|nr:type II secretion system protein GspG [Mariniblastus fucicola]QEG24819.1 Bacterial type II secretion system protein G [Mariniblastus fucicola]
MRIRTVLVVVAAIAVLAFVANSFVTTIPPHSMTLTAMTETHVRMHLYMLEHRECPDSLSELPKRDGYMNRTTDGWGRPLIYSVSDDGVISLSSLGRDGMVGGTGDDRDDTRRFRTRNDDGTLNIDDDLWTVTSEVHAPK